MTTVLLALLPIVVILAIGKVMDSAKLLSQEGWIGLERCVPIDDGLYDGEWTFWDRDQRVDTTKSGVYRNGDLIR